MKCKFCSGPAVHTCNWPVEKPASISHWDLEEHHVVVTEQAHRELRPLTVRRFYVSMINPPVHARQGRLSQYSGVEVPVTVYALRFPKDEYFLYYLYGRDRVNVLNPSACGNPMCEQHLRELGDNTRYCMEHWGAWQSVEVGVGAGVSA